ncbi:MAG: prealbumin-like fold domain-containing protein [[Clostridium] scindens]
MLCKTGQPGLQDLGYGQYVTDPDHHISFSVKWVQMGDIKITKFLGGDEEIKNPAVGAEFTLTHTETKEQVVIVTDENGVATTEDRVNFPIGRLEGGTWRVEETKTPDGFKTIDPFEVTIIGQEMYIPTLQRTRRLLQRSR